ncbi:hypothetical protein EDD22DRAFT_890487 [Suillus occidentalis]|nr:hypothetical protein EDD22DRAFT_890487 [Suillus occidentalis]
MSSEPSPGSTTLDILRAYSHPLSSSSPDATGSTNRPPDIDLSVQPPDSRFSTLSYSPASLLFTADKGLSSETNESPFRWNLPSPVEPEENGPLSGAGKGQLSEPTVHIWQGWRVVVFGSWFNLLLLLIPVSWTLSFVLEKHHKVIFIFSILSMIPLVKLHDLSTRELALRIGGTKAGLLNASMITALRKCELRIVQSSLIGSILSKLLLVLGMCFFAGGLRFSEQGFDQSELRQRYTSSLLSISVGALLLPAAYHFAIIYIAYLLFQFWSHKHLYLDTKLKSSRLSVKIPVNSRYLTEMLSASLNDKRGSMHDDQSSAPSSRRVSMISSNFPPLPRFPYRNSPLNSSSEVTLTESKEQVPEKGYTQKSTDPLAEGVPQQPTQAEHDHVDGGSLNPPWSASPMASPDETGRIRYASPEPMTIPERANLHRSPSAAESFREPQLSWMVTLLLLTLVTITVSITAEDLVESMDGIETAISKQWVGLVLLPAVSSIAECVTAVNTSVKDQLNLSVSIAVGSSIQTTLLVIPFMVTLGWIIGRPLALLFDPFESVVMQTMSYVVSDGKSNWLEGIILICEDAQYRLWFIVLNIPAGLYVIIAVSFWFYPGEVNSHLTP